MKRIFAAVMVLMLCASCAYAEDVSEGLKFENYGIGYYLAGRGTCTDEVIVVPSEYEGEPVVGVRTYAFEGDEALKGMILPDTLVEFDVYGIVGCPNMEYTVEGGAKYLGSETNPYLVFFSQVDKEATHVDVPEASRIVRNLGSREKIETVTLPDGLVYIGARGFQDDTSLKEITIPAGVGNIFNYTFNNCTSLEKVTILGKCSIADTAFQNCVSLKEITLQAGSHISGNDRIFADCTALTDIWFSGSQLEAANILPANGTVVCSRVTVHCTNGDFVLEP